MDGKSDQAHLILQSIGFLNFWKQSHIIMIYAYDYNNVGAPYATNTLGKDIGQNLLGVVFQKCCLVVIRN
jgi:hypothetical protein